MTATRTDELFYGIDNAFFKSSTHPSRVDVTYAPMEKRFYARFDRLMDGGWTCQESESTQTNLACALEGLSLHLQRQRHGGDYTPINLKRNMGQYWSSTFAEFPQIHLYAMRDHDLVKANITINLQDIWPHRDLVNERIICEATAPTMSLVLQKLDEVVIPSGAISLMQEGAAFRGAQEAIKKDFAKYYPKTTRPSS